MVIVVDMNVFVSACLGTGAPSAVIAACLRGEHAPPMGAALVAEYEDVLGRSTLFRSGRLSANERDELLDIFVAHCRWTRIYSGCRPNIPDEADDHLVELAVAGGAERIVTANVHDLAVGELPFPGLKAVTPAHFLEETRA
jgi:predicted nucleic acid-binding protein